jgi:hypothetical protein
MGMETLKNAERAAGFAMAAGDELAPEEKRRASADANPWRPGEAVLAQPKTTPSRLPRWGDWLKGVTSLFGAPA